MTQPEIDQGTEPKPPTLAWVAGVVLLAGVFWAAVYWTWIEPLEQQLDRLTQAEAELGRELPTDRAREELEQVEGDLGELASRWPPMTVATLEEKLAQRSITVLKAYPGKHIGEFLVEVDGSGHGIRLILPDVEGKTASASGGIPAVLYFRRVRNTSPPPGRYLLEGVGRLEGLAPTGAGPTLAREEQP
jgi:hypothetical protein